MKSFWIHPAPSTKTQRKQKGKTHWRPETVQVRSNLEGFQISTAPRYGKKTKHHVSHEKNPALLSILNPGWLIGFLIIDY